MRTANLPTDCDFLLNEVQAADRLNLSIRTLQAWRSRGYGPVFIRAGRAVRYRPRDLTAWLDQRAVEHPSREAARP